MSSDTSDRAVKLPNRFVIADSDKSGSTTASAEPDAMLISRSQPFRTAILPDMMSFMIASSLAF